MPMSRPVGSWMLKKFSGNSDRGDPAPRPIHHHGTGARQPREDLVAISYTFGEHEVFVRALWGASRGKGPFIEP